MPEDKEALMEALLALAEARAHKVSSVPELPQEQANAMELYRHFVDHLNRSSERDMQLAELRN